MNKVFVIGLSGESIFLNVDHFHKDGETLHADKLFTECGGKGYNQAVALKKFGSEISYLTAVGNDIYGDKCEKHLESLEIKTFIKRKEVPTALATIITNKDGDNQVTVYPGATEQLNINDVLSVEEEIAKCDVLLLQLEVPLKVNLKACEIAKKHNLKIVINPAPANNYTLELLQMADIITPNFSEAKEILSLRGVGPAGIIDKVKKNNIKNMIVTHGEYGAYLYTNNDISFVNAINVEAIDTTGAGDTFNAMLVYKLSNGCDLIESMRWANAAAGLSTTKKGVIESIPSFNDVINIIKNNA